MIRSGLILALLLATNASAQSKKHKAHVHGAAKINVVIEGKKATFEFIAPGHDVLGFEHEAKTDEDKKKVETALEKLRNSGETLVKFDEKIACVVSNQKAEVVAEGAVSGGEAAHDHDHAHGHDHDKPKKPAATAKKAAPAKKHAGHNEVMAQYTVSCPALIAGTEMKFGVTEVFPSISEVVIQVIADAKQVGATIKKDAGSIRVPPEVK